MRLFYLLIIFLGCLVGNESTTYANNILLPGESLLVNQCLTLQADGIEWDQAIFSVNERSLELYVEKNGQKETIWTSGAIVEASRKITSLDMCLDGQLKPMCEEELLERSYPKFPVKPVPGSYLIIEESVVEKFRLALYSPEKELLWTSDRNFRGYKHPSYVLYPLLHRLDNTWSYPAEIILRLEGDGTTFDTAILEFDGNQLFLFECYGSTKQLIWCSHQQNCGNDCKGRLVFVELFHRVELVTQACGRGRFYVGLPLSCLFIDKDSLGKARLVLYSETHGIYWTSEVNQMRTDNMKSHWD